MPPGSERTEFSVVREQEAAYVVEVRARQEKQLQWRARKLGYTVVKIEPGPEAGPAAEILPGEV